jgi:hypothetical protein
MKRESLSTYSGLSQAWVDLFKSRRGILGETLRCGAGGA